MKTVLTTFLATIATCTLGLTLLAGGFAVAAAPTPAPHDAAVPLPPVAKIDWKAMSKKERGAYMKKAVVPEMQKIFAEFDPKKYKRIKCPLCHGDGVNKAYEMPNPQLPKLPTDEAGFKALGEKKPEMAKFMGTRVKPAMAALLGLPEFTPQNPTGFGCFQCHTKDGAATAPAPGPKAGAAKPGAAAPAPAKPVVPAAAPK